MRTKFRVYGDKTEQYIDRGAEVTSWQCKDCFPHNYIYHKLYSMGPVCVDDQFTKRVFCPVRISFPWWRSRQTLRHRKIRRLRYSHLKWWIAWRLLILRKLHDLPNHQWASIPQQLESHVMSQLRVVFKSGAGNRRTAQAYQISSLECRRFLFFQKPTWFFVTLCHFWSFFGNFLKCMQNERVHHRHGFFRNRSTRMNFH